MENLMIDDIIINKITVIENCLKRIKEEYIGHERELDSNYTKQDSIILNLQRACEAAIDLGIRVLRMKKLQPPQSSRDVFDLLKKADIVSSETCTNMQAMTGFRNIAVHDYQKVNIAVVRSILQTHLADFETLIHEIKQQFSQE
jgi:uncharacterized protein YutE (UPF0331/DUF86 family)